MRCGTPGRCRPCSASRPRKRPRARSHHDSPTPCRSLALHDGQEADRHACGSTPRPALCLVKVTVRLWTAVLGVLPVPAGAIVGSYTSQVSVPLIAFAWSGGLATTGTLVPSKLSPTRAHLTCSRSLSTNYSALCDDWLAPSGGRCVRTSGRADVLTAGCGLHAEPVRGHRRVIGSAGLQHFTVILPDGGDGRVPGVLTRGPARRV
jgi:hypothetical protein